MGNWVSQKVLTKASKKCWGNKNKKSLARSTKSLFHSESFKWCLWSERRNFLYRWKCVNSKLSRKPPKSTFCMAIVNFFSQITFKFVLWRVTFISRPVMHFFASRLGGIRWTWDKLNELLSFRISWTNRSSTDKKCGSGAWLVINYSSLLVFLVLRFLRKACVLY